MKPHIAFPRNGGRHKDIPADIKWLYDCGWYGWVYDMKTFDVSTSHGQTSKPRELRQKLEMLRRWPRLMNIPKFK